MFFVQNYYFLAPVNFVVDFIEQTGINIEYIFSDFGKEAL